MLGAGKYDNALTIARSAAGATAAALIVLDGTDGAGFSVQAPLLALVTLPTILRDLADQIEADFKKGKL